MGEAKIRFRECDVGDWCPVTCCNSTSGTVRISIDSRHPAEKDLRKAAKRQGLRPVDMNSEIWEFERTLVPKDGRSTVVWLRRA